MDQCHHKGPEKWKRVTEEYQIDGSVRNQLATAVLDGRRDREPRNESSFHKVRKLRKGILHDNGKVYNPPDTFILAERDPCQTPDLLNWMTICLVLSHSVCAYLF